MIGNYFADHTPWLDPPCPLPRWKSQLLPWTVLVSPLPKARGSPPLAGCRFLIFWSRRAARHCCPPVLWSPRLHSAPMGPTASRVTCSPLLRELNHNKCLKKFWYLIKQKTYPKKLLLEIFFLKTHMCINYCAAKIIFIHMTLLYKNRNISEIHIYNFEEKSPLEY